MTEFPLILHLGAHRTGSTSVQWMLDSKAETLRPQGVKAGDMIQISYWQPTPTDGVLTHSRSKTKTG